MEVADNSPNVPPRYICSSFAFPMDVELSYFQRSCLLHNVPWEPPHLWEILGVGRTLLCKGARLNLIHFCILEKLLGKEKAASSWDQSRPGGKRTLTMQHLQLAATTLLHTSTGLWSPVLTRSFQIKMSLDWLSWWRTNCWGCCNGENYGPLFLGSDSVLLACRSPWKEPGLQTPSRNVPLTTWWLLQREQSWRAYLQTSKIAIMRGFVGVLINSN